MFEEEMEEAYRASLFKSFTKTLEDGFFPVVIVDAIHDKVRCMICCIYLHFIAPLTIYLGRSFLRHERCL